LLLAFAGLTGGAAWILRGIETDPELVFLTSEGRAEWIKAPDEPNLYTRPKRFRYTLFLRSLQFDSVPEEIELRFVAFRAARVLLDGDLIYEDEADTERWKRTRRIDLAPRLSPGRHTLQILVANDRGPPMLRLSLPALEVYSDESWDCQARPGHSTTARTAARIEDPPIAHAFPSAREGFRTTLPYLVLVLAIVAAASIWSPRGGASAVKRYLEISPSGLRWVLLSLLTLLFLNNLFKLGLNVGADILPHYKYVHYIVEYRALPGRIVGGLQAFQAPLFHVMAAGLHGVLGAFAEEATTDRLLRLIPLACGLVQVELTYRVLRRLFPGRADSQSIGLLVGGLMPMALYRVQVVGNEPLVAVLGSATVLLALRVVLAPAAVTPVFLAGMGALWGAAILSKVSALVLGPFLIFALVWWLYQARPRWRRALSGLGGFVLAAVAVAGWHFVRTYLLYGKPVIGGWDPDLGYAWWQAPGYRTLGQYHVRQRLGRALRGDVVGPRDELASRPPVGPQVELHGDAREPLVGSGADTPVDPGARTVGGPHREGLRRGQGRSSLGRPGAALVRDRRRALPARDRGTHPPGALLQRDQGDLRSGRRSLSGGARWSGS
jgi:hypothetical protein